MHFRHLHDLASEWKQGRREDCLLSYLQNEKEISMPYADMPRINS